MVRVPEQGVKLPLKLGGKLRKEIRGRRRERVKRGDREMKRKRKRWG